MSEIECTLGYPKVNHRYPQHNCYFGVYAPILFHTHVISLTYNGTEENGGWLKCFGVFLFKKNSCLYIYIYTSTLHCRGKNGRSKKIGQTNQKMIHFVPNMYVSGKISALRPGTQTVMIFGTTKKIRKLPKTTRFQDLRVFACFCGFLRAFCGFFCGVLRVLSPVVWCAANIFWPLSHQTQKHAIKVLKSKI